MPTAISIIIPTLNEADNLGTTLSTLDSDLEVIVSDGGSSDNTKEIAKQFGTTLHRASRTGRATQLNEGAALANGDFLLFLHADTVISIRTQQNFKNFTSNDTKISGGGFYRFFDSPSRFLRFTCHLANLRSKYCGIFLGDQGIFVRRDIFEKLGGFDTTLPFGEDLEFSIRLKRVAKIKAIGPPVLSSARRFRKRGPFRQTLRDFFLTLQIIFKK